MNPSSATDVTNEAKFWESHLIKDLHHLLLSIDWSLWPFKSEMDVHGQTLSDCKTQKWKSILINFQCNLMMSVWKTKCQCHFRKSIRIGLYPYEYTLRHIFIHHKNVSALSIIIYEIDNYDLDQNCLQHIEVQGKSYHATFSPQ